MASRDDKLKSDLARARISERTTEAALEIDGILQTWRRRVMKRELGHRALSDLGLDIDLAQFDALMAIWAPSNEFGIDEEGETMVSTVAARLGIDPSRASRLTADLIRQGLARRAVSQQDARRTILEVTEDGARIVRAVRSYKFLLLGTFLEGWSAEELETFVPLLARFTTWVDRSADVSDRLSGEIAKLRDTLPEADPAT